MGIRYSRLADDCQCEKDELPSPAQEFRGDISGGIDSFKDLSKLCGKYFKDIDNVEDYVAGLRGNIDSLRAAGLRGAVAGRKLKKEAE